MRPHTGDTKKEINALCERTAHIRYQFLTAELQTCSLALDMAKFERSTGNFEVAQRELAAADAVISNIRRFFPELSPGQKMELEPKLDELQAKRNLLGLE